jgi:Zn finger protein HypA/HybF involved in hydrogenase expression
VTAHERYLAGYRTHAVDIECRDCGHEWEGTQVTEYGMWWLEPHEECPQCGSMELDAADVDEQDIQERKAEARGEDF